jgi:hypothetical protein
MKLFSPGCRCRRCEGEERLGDPVVWRPGKENGGMGIMSFLLQTCVHFFLSQQCKDILSYCALVWVRVTSLTILGTIRSS